MPALISPVCCNPVTFHLLTAMPPPCRPASLGQAEWPLYALYMDLFKTDPKMQFGGRSLGFPLTEEEEEQHRLARATRSRRSGLFHDCVGACARARPAYSRRWCVRCGALALRVHAAAGGLMPSVHCMPQMPPECCLTACCPCR